MLLQQYMYDILITKFTNKGMRYSFSVGNENDRGRRSDKIHKALRRRNSLSLSWRNTERVLWTVWWHCGSGNHPRTKQSKIKGIWICKLLFSFLCGKIGLIKLLSRFSGSYDLVTSFDDMILALINSRMKGIMQTIELDPREISQGMHVQQGKK